MKTRLASTLLVLSALSLGAGCSSSEDSSTDAPEVNAGALAHEYSGTIKNLPIMLRLDASGSRVTGSYFYTGKPTNGDVLTLAGTLSGSKMHLEESLNGGTKTGLLDVTIAAGGLSGTWSKPDGSGGLRLTMTPVATGSLVTVKRTLEQSIPSTAGDQPGVCEKKVEYFELFGLPNAAAEAAINQALAPSKLDPACDWPSSEDTTSEIKLNGDGFLVVRESSGYDGGAHPEMSSTAKNFVVATGKQLSAKDILKADALPQLKELLKTGVDGSLDEESKNMAMDEIDHIGTLNYIDVEVRHDGLYFDLTNEFPHVIVALAPAVLFDWTKVRDLLAPGSEVAALAH